MKVLFLAWRDVRHPEAGGSERYVQTLASQLVQRGHHVSVRSPRYPGAPAVEIIDGVRHERAGGRLTVYARSFVRAAVADPDTVIVDVCNGLPFWAGLLPGRPVVLLVHHVHRAQWQMIYPGLVGRAGWFIEARLAPMVYRHGVAVAVSDSTRRDLEELGYEADRVHVVRNAPLSRARPATRRTDEREARLVVLGRLVPHKQIEHALHVVAALAPRFPGMTLDIVGDGWWRDRLVAHARQLGIGSRVHFHGFVSEDTKWELLEQASVMIMPSAKEGWCLAVSEAGLCETPTIGYRSSGGLTESVLDGETGWIVDDLGEMVTIIESALHDPDLILELGRAAREYAELLDATLSAQEFEGVLERALSARRR